MGCPTRKGELVAKSNRKAGEVATPQQGSSLVVSEQEEQCRTVKANKARHKPLKTR